MYVVWGCAQILWTKRDTRIRTTELTHTHFMGHMWLLRIAQRHNGRCVSTWWWVSSTLCSKRWLAFGSHSTLDFACLFLSSFFLPSLFALYSSERQTECVRFNFFSFVGCGFHTRAFNPGLYAVKREWESARADESSPLSFYFLFEHVCGGANERVKVIKPKCKYVFSCVRSDFLYWFHFIYVVTCDEFVRVCVCHPIGTNRPTIIIQPTDQFVR